MSAAVHGNKGKTPHNRKSDGNHKFVAKRLLDTHRQFIDDMVWNGMKREQAAEKAGFSPSWARALLNSPPVAAYLNQQLKVRRTGERAGNLQRLTEIRDQDDNKNAAVTAIKLLEEMADADNGGAMAAGGTRAGIVINVVTPSATVTASAKDKVLELQANEDKSTLSTDDDVLWIAGGGGDDAQR